MPYKDKQKQKEYFRIYKLKNHDDLLEKRRLQYRNSHNRPNFWSTGQSDNAICLNCGGNANRKPKKCCLEERHMKNYLARNARNNKYRNERRKTDPYYASGYSKTEWVELSRLKYRQLKYEIIKKLGGKCCMCGFEDIRALEIDHLISGNGGKERMKYGWAYFRELNKMDYNKFINKFQCLCSNCHSIKSYNEKYIPIETEKIAKKDAKRI